MCARRKKSDTVGKSAEMSYLQYMRSLWPTFAYASVCLGWQFLPPAPPLSQYIITEPTQLNSPTIYCWAWRTSLAYQARIMTRITKAYINSSFQWSAVWKKKKKSWWDNIKGTTLISGEHVKPCNETYWKCLITAREMKLQDDSLIKQWLRIFCLLSNTVCSAF